MNIVIIEQNKIFRESLKTALDQISDFTVISDMDNKGDLQCINNALVDLILIDYSLGVAKCKETIDKALKIWPFVKFFLLTNNKEECNYNYFKTIDTILKSSAKREFENKIKELSKMIKLKINI